MLDTLIHVLRAAASFLVALGLIVFVHELGHHVIAKLFGVRVRTFSLGFGKRLWGFQRGGTDYRVSAIPLGGYVRMGGEMPEEATGDPTEFLSKARWKRILVYTAGPAMNVVFSVALMTGLFMWGIQVQGFQGSPPVIGYVDEDSAGAKAGIEVGDRVLTVNGEKVSEWNDFSFAVMTSPERVMNLDVKRGSEHVAVTLVPAKNPRYEYGEAGLWPKAKLLIVDVVGAPARTAGFEPGDEVRSVDGQPLGSIEDFVKYIQGHGGAEVEVEVFRKGEFHALTVVPTDEDGDGLAAIGVSLNFYRKLAFREAVVESVKYNVGIVRQSALIIGKLITREVSARSTLSGPIEIAVISARAAQSGLKDWLLTVAFLSISIGIMNLLPIPVLDGGHITILLVESVMRRDMSIAIKERVTQFGFMVLMVLMAMVIFFDIAKQFPS